MQLLSVNYLEVEPLVALSCSNLLQPGCAFLKCLVPLFSLNNSRDNQPFKLFTLTKLVQRLQMLLTLNEDSTYHLAAANPQC